MPAEPTPSPSAPPASEWGNSVTVATPIALLTVAERPAAAASAAAVMAVAQVVPASVLPSKHGGPQYIATARPLPPLPTPQTRVLSEEEQREHRRWESFIANGMPGTDGSIGQQAVHAGYHGRDATPGLPGQAGGRIDLFVSTMNTEETGKITVAGSILQNENDVNNSAPPLVTTYYVPTMTDFCVYAQGGAGGNGGRGESGGNGEHGHRGRDATRYSYGRDGGPGQDGGNAGAGSNGGEGGRGGKINIQVSDQDSYFLLAFSCCAKYADAVRGGIPGRVGLHGSPGMPGEGGKGGRSTHWTTRDNDGNLESNYSPGGSDGPRGREGMRANGVLTCGGEGGTGKVTITVDNLHQYSHRYDLQLSSVSIQSPQRLHQANHVFQFSDLIQITDMMCQNVGGMISPVQGTHIHFKMAAWEHIIPSLDNMGWLARRLEPEELGSIQGKLFLRIHPPDIRKFHPDMEPFRVKETLHLGATQLGSYGFQRPYANFHTDGITLEFRFPVENQTKLQGLPTIRAGSGMRVKFLVINTSLRDLGVLSQDGRKLSVQFYQNLSDKYDIAFHHIDLSVAGVECNLEGNNSEAILRGTQFEIQLLKPGEIKEFNGILRISNQVTPYSRLGLQAEILLEELENNYSGEADSLRPKVIPIQRRLLEVSSEPTYVPSQENHVVLVSCASTTKEQFNAWSDLLTRRLGLSVEYYSVSIYGSLDPTFCPSNGGANLAQAFARKLVIVLDTIFNPLDKSVSKMEPSRMMPNGSQSQTSGYDKSTRWLLSGSSDDAIKQACMAHFTAPANDVSNYASLSAYKKATKEQLQRERKEGCVSDERIYESVIRINLCTIFHGSNPMPKKANAVKSFLVNMDPLRQYVVEPRTEVVKDDDGVGYRLLIVRRGYCRSANTTNVMTENVTKQHIPPKQNDGNAIIAVVGSLPLDTLNFVMANAAEDEFLLNITLDAFTQHLLWEVANVLSGDFNVRDTEDIKTVFPSLSVIILSSKLKPMAHNVDDNRIALSKLLARVDCVANSRDLKIWTTSRLSSRRAVRKLLLKIVETVEKDWAEFISAEERLEEVERVEMEVVKYLTDAYGHYTLKMKSAGRWRKGLLHVCSYRNQDKYTCGSGFCGPTIRLCEMETLEYTKKSRAIEPSKTIISEQNCTIMREQAKDTLEMARQLLKSTKDTRDKHCLGDEREFEIQLHD